VPLREIRASAHNPRGPVKLGQSFNRLVDSIRSIGDILVPIVVQKLQAPEGDIKYELIDGERRYRAALALRKADAPAHVVESNVPEADLRKFMFHLHMTREQWGALAQVESLAEMYNGVDLGIPFAEKTEWAKKIAENTYMDPQTATDRVRILAWPKQLRDDIRGFQEGNPGVDIYSYVLAVEASLIEPYVRATRDHTGSQLSDGEINVIRKSLLDKLLKGVGTGGIRKRDQIRQASVLFGSELSNKEWVAAKKIFRRLSTNNNFSFDDVVAEIQIDLPALASEKPAKPRRVIAMMNSLSEILRGYRKEYLEIPKKVAAKKVLRADFLKALSTLAKSLEELRDKL
jgi:hypothetical protein